MIKRGKFGKIGAIICLLLTCVLTFSLAACKDGGDKSDALTLNKTTATVAVGDTTTISVTSSTAETIEWTVDKAEIATVEGSGAGNKLCTVSGVAEGAAVVTAKAGDAKATCTVTVTKTGEGQPGDPDAETVTIKLGDDAVSGVQYLHTGDTVTYTATASKGGTVSWESSDENVATVENGAVTAKTAGQAVITAKVSDTVKATVTVDVAGPTDIAFGAEAAFTVGWRYWSGDGAVTVASCVNYANDNAVKINYTMTSGQFYSIQLFYKDKTAGKDHAVSMTVVSPVEAAITINGEAKNLVVGENDITVESFTGSAVCIQFGVDGKSTVLGNDLTFEFKNIELTTPNAEAELVAPTFEYADDTKIITITDNDNDSEKVTGYELGFFASATAVEPVAVVSVENGVAVNLDSVLSGEYTVRLRAVSTSATVINSDWSETTATIDWENEKTPIATEAGADTWYYYAHTDGTGVEEAYVDGDGNVHLVNVTGNTAETWSFQLKYDSSKTITAISMTVRATSAGAIGINLGNKDFELVQVEGEDYYEVEVSVTCDGTGLVICLGTNQESYGDKSKNLTGDITFSNIVFTYAE